MRFLRPRLRIAAAIERVLGCINAVVLSVVIGLFITGILVWKTMPTEEELGTRYVPYSQKDLSSTLDKPFYKGCVDTEQYISDPKYHKMSAAFVVLTRNRELEEVIESMRSIESHFNQWFNYPYVFLNDEPFSDEFKTQIVASTNALVEFGTIDEADWNFPPEVSNSLKYHYAMDNQGDRRIMYGNLESYHKMCRFYSGLFYKHPLVQKYEWYWRLEPGVEFFCDLTYDPFYEMDANDKSYGFTILLPELYWTVPNLYRYTKAFLNKYKVSKTSLWPLFSKNYDLVELPEEVDEATLKDLKHHKKWMNSKEDVDAKISEIVVIKELVKNPHDSKLRKEGLNRLITRAKSQIPLLEDKFDAEEYNLCHFWSNFEIARVSAFDNDIYNSYFQYLEKSGGFWTERWGDAPVHSLGLALVLDASDIHYFRDIGYQHTKVRHCPANSMEHGFLPYKPKSPRYKHRRKYDNGKTYGSGCRCRCPRNIGEYEEIVPDCLSNWLDLNFYEDTNTKSTKPQWNEKTEQLRREYLDKLKMWDDLG